MHKLNYNKNLLYALKQNKMTKNKYAWDDEQNIMQNNITKLKQ